MSPESTGVPSRIRAWHAVFRPVPRYLYYDAAPPSPNDSQVLVQISHAALSLAGLNLMRAVPSFFRSNAIPEIDLSGLIVVAGPSAPAHLAPGTTVFGTVSKRASMLSGVGVLAEYILLDSSCIAVKPSGMSFAQAAGLSSLGQVALAMVSQGVVKKRDRVLVNGGTGEVGSIAVQLASALGAHVIATCSEPNAEFVTSLGVVRAERRAAKLLLTSETSIMGRRSLKVPNDGSPILA
jgi:NADPH:quinone reductase-like Zn-dependent oxidoreductase